MKALKTLFFSTILAISPAVFAAEVFVSHFESLHGMTVHSAEYQTNGAVEPGLESQPLVLSFEALGRRFDLDLEANDRVRAALPDDDFFSNVGVYRGRLLNNPDSWVRVVMHDGVPRGLIWDGESMFAIEAPGDSAVSITEPVIYRVSDLNILPGTMSCGTSFLSGNAEKMFASIEGEVQGAVSQQAPGAVSEITASLMSDASFTADHGGPDGAAAAMSARFNNIDGYFSEQVGVQVRVVLVEAFDDTNDPFDNTLDASDLLDQVSEYRLQNSAYNSTGVTHLWTGRNVWSGDPTNTSAVGVAWRGALCEAYFSAGLSEGRAGLTTDSLIAAHELGHNFNAEHDGEAGSSCENEPQTFIMAPRVNNNDQFSACSINVMQIEAAGASCVVALPAIDAGIALNGQASNVLLGANTEYEFRVSANGTLNVSNVVADFTIPSVFTLDSITSSSSAALCTSGAGTASCTFGDMAGLSSETITITGTPASVGSGMLTASVSTTDADERAANDQESFRVTVDPAVNLVVNQPATTPVFVNDATTVTVAIDNVSILPASNVVLLALLDSGLQIDSVDWSIGTCTVNAQQIDCQAGTFDAQSTSSLSVSVTAVSTGLQDVTVSITSTEADADTSNNNATRAVNVVSPQDEDDEGGGSPSPLMLLILAAFARRFSAIHGRRQTS